MSKTRMISRDLAAPALWLTSKSAHRSLARTCGSDHGARGTAVSAPGPLPVRARSLKVTPSTGHVFQDLGFSADETEHLLVRSDLLIPMQKAIASRRLMQAKAATIGSSGEPSRGRWLEARTAQNRNFNPNCIWRGVLTVVRMVPKSALPRVALGRPYDG